VLPYLRGRGIDRATSERFRLGYVADPITGHEQYKGRLVIPSIGPAGNVYGLRFRSLDGSEPKYLGLSGQVTRLFNVRAINEADDIICITEGEIDAISLAVAGLNAVGVPGASAWKRHHARLFVGFAKVYVFGDGDPAGRLFASTVCESLRNSQPVPMPEGLDINSILVGTGIESVLALMEE
jgi:DNA primase